MSALSLLSGVKRKSDFGAVRSALDPQLTFLRKGFIVNAFAHIQGVR